MAKRNDFEHKEQVNVFKWAKLQEKKFPLLKLLFAVPNAGKRSKIQGAYMKAEGLKSGVPDICLPVPNGEHHALFIELKYGKNPATPSQKKWILRLNNAGNKAVVCIGWVEAVKTIKEYLSIK